MKDNQKISQTPFLDGIETINNSGNQTSDLSSSTNITSTEKQTDNNLFSQTEPLRAESTLQTPETGLSKYRRLWEVIKNATQLEELNGEELSDKNIDRINLYDLKQSLKYFRETKKSLLSLKITDAELTENLKRVKKEELKGKFWYSWYDLVKGVILTKTQEIISATIKEIPVWKEFFAERGITDQAHQKKWKQTGLSPLSNSRINSLPETERAWENGWTDLTDPNISVENSRSGEIDYFYEEIIKGETKKNSLKVSLSKERRSEVESFVNLISKIGKVNNLEDLSIEEELSRLKGSLLRIINKKKMAKIDEFWERFFQIHPEIDTDAKRQAWTKSGLNPSESSPGAADSEADQAWGKGWTDLTINTHYNEIGKIERMDDGKVRYHSYWLFSEFNSFSGLVTNSKDNLDKEHFWIQFIKNYNNNFADSPENRKRVEEWRQKGYFPSDASRYQKNWWDADKVDKVSGKASYRGKQYSMNQSKLDIEKNLVIENLEKEKKNDNTITENELEGWKVLLRDSKNFDELDDRWNEIQSQKNRVNDEDNLQVDSSELKQTNYPLRNPHIVSSDIRPYQIGTKEEKAKTHEESRNSTESEDNELHDTTFVYVPETYKQTEIPMIETRRDADQPSGEKWGGRKIAGAIAIGAVVVGAGGVVVGKLIQNRRKTKNRERRTPKQQN